MVERLCPGRQTSGGLLVPSPVLQVRVSEELKAWIRRNGGSRFHRFLLEKAMADGKKPKREKKT